MTHSTPLRAANSLSRKKFLDRLNKGLPLFVAYGEHNHISDYENCRDVFRNGHEGEFVSATKVYASNVEVINLSLNDMNVERNAYNQNFVFRTRWAAENYLKGIK